MDKLMAAMQEKETKAREKAGGEVKMEDVEARPRSERDDSVEETAEISRRNRLYFVSISRVVTNDALSISTTTRSVCLSRRVCVLACVREPVRGCHPLKKVVFMHTRGRYYRAGFTFEGLAKNPSQSWTSPHRPS